MKYIKEFDQLNESLSQNEYFEKYQPKDNIPVASNTANYSWEYNSWSSYAFLYMHKKTGDLTLKIIKTWTRNGLGRGKTDVSVADNVKVGNIKKPELGEILSILTKNGGPNTKFKRDSWIMFDDSNEMPLSVILKNSKFQRIAKIEDMYKDDKVETPNVEPNKLELIRKNLSKLSDIEIEELFKKLS